MIVSFYNNEFNGLQDNASLVVDKDSFSLTRRPVDTDSLSCTCEAYTEDIQPTFMIVKDDRGRYVYGAFAGIPLKTAENKTEITGTDLKSLLSSDVILQVGSYSSVNAYISYMFNEFKTQVNKGFEIELEFMDYLGGIAITDLQPIAEAGSYNVWTELQAILKYYDLYLDTRIDLVNKKVVYIIGRTLLRNVDVRLWVYKIENVGKWVAPVNEAQGYYKNSTGVLTAGYKWILLSNGKITTDESLRDIYPVKKAVAVNTSSIEEANREALEKLLDSVYQEDITLPANNIDASFESKFSIYIKQGGGLYKELPCGELIYDSTGLVNVKIGYRYIGAEFI